MRIVTPSVEFMWVTPDPLRAIEIADRTCYKSEDKITPESNVTFAKKLLELGHEAMIEHASASIKVTCDRGVMSDMVAALDPNPLIRSHEIVRHRIASYAQESTRYCNYSKEKFGTEITVIDPKLHFKNAESYTVWEEAMSYAEVKYMQLLALGEAPQMARTVLPNSLKTEIICTFNLREWRHFVRLRTSKKAHPQMVEVANGCLYILQRCVPVLFDEFGLPITSTCVVKNLST